MSENISSPTNSCPNTTFTCYCIAICFTEWNVRLSKCFAGDDTTTDTVCLRSDPYLLQFYNINGKVCKEIEVATRTPLDPSYGSRQMEFQKNFYSVDAFTMCGKWLVTYNSFHSNIISNEGELKFFVKEDDTYRLTTKSTFKPTEKVLCIKATTSSSTPTVCTTTSTGKVYLWELQQGSEYWACTTEFKLNNAPCKVAAFSTDESLLALAYKNEIALYSPTNRSFFGFLNDLYIGNITHLEFIKDTPFLVAVSLHGLTVYNVIEQSTVYCYYVDRVVDFAMDKDSDTFAVIAELRVSRKYPLGKKKKNAKNKKEGTEADKTAPTKEAEKVETTETTETASKEGEADGKQKGKAKSKNVRVKGSYILFFSGTSAAPYDVIGLEKHTWPTACTFVKGEGSCRSLAVMLKSHIILRYDVRTELQGRGALKEEEASVTDGLTAAIIKQLTAVPESTDAPHTAEVSGINDLSAKEETLRTHLGVSVTAMQDPEVLFYAVTDSLLTKEVADSLHGAMDVEEGGRAEADAAEERTDKEQGADKADEDEEEFIDATEKLSTFMQRYDAIFGVQSHKKHKEKHRKHAAAPENSDA